MFTKVFSCANVGLDCELVTVEADLSPASQTDFVIVGLADTAIQEAKERIRFAVRNSGLDFPRHKKTVNLAPADLRKEGPAYDMAIAVAILKSGGQITTNLDDCLFIGELALNGATRHTAGILPAVIFAKERGFKNIFLPESNSLEAALISGINIFPVKNLYDLACHLQEHEQIEPLAVLKELKEEKGIDFEIDMADVCGQEQAKRALEIAAAGAHNVLLSGPPGSGKTLLAKTMPTILPDMCEEEVLEVTKVYSIAGLLPKEKPIILERPFRSPHHTGSGVALVGGGKMPKPGEISLAHRGILFLDEFPEFSRSVLENLRQPLEDGLISISRAQGTLTFPARFTLIASQNPCPCGYYTDPEKNCICSPSQIIKYQKRISGPILDRIDLHVEVPRVAFEKMQGSSLNEKSIEIKKRVDAARSIQQKRFEKSSTQYNAEMQPAEIKSFCQLEQTGLDLLKEAVTKLHLSARTFHRILKVARTIADLEASETVLTQHVAEALQYRPKE